MENFNVEDVPSGMTDITPYIEMLKEVAEAFCNTDHMDQQSSLNYMNKCMDLISDDDQKPDTDKMLSFMGAVMFLNTQMMLAAEGQVNGFQDGFKELIQEEILPRIVDSGTTVVPYWD